MIDFILGYVSGIASLVLATFLGLILATVLGR